MNTVQLVQDNLNPDLQLAGVPMTVVDSRTRLAEQVVAEDRKG